MGLVGHKEIAGGNFDCPGWPRPQRPGVPFPTQRKLVFLIAVRKWDS